MLNFILDLLFPKYCIDCQKEGTYLCSKCQGKIILVREPLCPICQRKTVRGNFCQKHREKFALSGVIPASYFHEGPLREAIHHLKYNSVRELSENLGAILLSATRSRWPKGKLILVPVPLFWLRKAQRGFNQAELLCQQLATSNSKLAINYNLSRVKNTKPQATIKEKERQQNVKNAFLWLGGKNKLQKYKVLLVDDVTTTFSTLNEAAKVLKVAGAKEVWGLVLAKG